MEKVSVQREELEKLILDEVYSSTTMKLVSIEGDGGIGKTTLLRKLHGVLETSIGINTSNIIDLNNSKFWNIDLLLSTLLEEIFQKKSLELNSYQKINLLAQLIKNSRKPSVLFFDTAEAIKNSSTRKLLLTYLKRIEHVIIIIAERPHKDSLIDTEVHGLDEKQLIPYRLKGLSQDEARNLLHDEDVNLSETAFDNLMYFCSSRENNEIRPLYLKLAIEKIKSKNHEISELLEQHLSQDEGKTWKRDFITLLVDAYMQQNELDGKVTSILSIIRKPFTKRLLLELINNINQSNQESSIHYWESFSTREWIRCTDNDIVNIHDEFMEAITKYSRIHSSVYDTKDEVISDVLNIVNHSLKSLAQDSQLTHEELLIQSRIEILSNPEKGLVFTIEKAAELAGKSYEAYSELLMLDIINIETEYPRTSIINSLGFIKDIKTTFENNPYLIQDSSNILKRLVFNKKTSLSVLSEFYNKNINKIASHEEEATQLKTDYAYASIESKNQSNEIKSILEEINAYHLKRNNKKERIETLSVLGLFNRNQSNYEEARKYYNQSLELFFDDSILSTNRNINSVIRTLTNYAALEAHSISSHEAIFIISQVKSIINSYKEQEKNISKPLITKVKNLDCEIHKFLHNYKLAIQKTRELQKSTESNIANKLFIETRSLTYEILKSQEDNNKSDIKLEELEEKVERLTLDAKKDNPNLLSQLYNLNAKIKLQYNKLDDSYKLLKESVRLAKAEGNLEVEIDSLLKLNGINLSRNDLSDSAFHELERLATKDIDHNLDGINQSKLQYAHFLIEKSDFDEKSLDTYHTTINKVLLPILRGQTGSDGAHGLPAGYQCWLKSLFRIKKRSRKIAERIINRLVEDFSLTPHYHVSKDMDFRAALVSIPLSFKRELGFLDDELILENGFTSNTKRAMSLLDRAKEAQGYSRYEEARNYYTSCIILSTGDDALHIKGLAQLNLSFLEILQGNIHDALTFSHLGLADIIYYSNITSIDDHLAESYRLYAETYRYSHNYDEAHKNYLIANSFKNTTLETKIKINQQLAICLYQLNLDSNNPSKAELNKLLGIAEKLIDTEPQKLSIEKHKPMLYFRRGIINSSLEDLKESLLEGWINDSEESILISSIAIINMIINKGTNDLDLKIGSTSFTKILDEHKMRGTIKNSTNHSEKMIFNEALRSQLLLALEIHDLLSNTNKKHGIHYDRRLEKFADSLSSLVPKIMKSPFSTIDKNATPLGYNTWIKNLQDFLSDKDMELIIFNTAENWSEQENLSDGYKISGSCWAFLTALSVKS